VIDEACDARKPLESSTDFTPHHSKIITGALAPGAQNDCLNQLATNLTACLAVFITAPITKNSRITPAELPDATHSAPILSN
jgi:hypothetical protein